MAYVINDPSAPTMVFSRNQPIAKITIKHNDLESRTLIREGNAILTNKHIKKNTLLITTQNVGCDNCGWKCKSNNKNEAKIKVRLHRKICVRP